MADMTTPRDANETDAAQFTVPVATKGGVTVFARPAFDPATDDVLWDGAVFRWQSLLARGYVEPLPG